MSILWCTWSSTIGAARSGLGQTRRWVNKKFQNVREWNAANLEVELCGTPATVPRSGAINSLLSTLTQPPKNSTRTLTICTEETHIESVEHDGQQDRRRQRPKTAESGRVLLVELSAQPVNEELSSGLRLAGTRRGLQGCFYTEVFAYPRSRSST